MIAVLPNLKPDDAAACERGLSPSMYANSSASFFCSRFCSWGVGAGFTAGRSVRVSLLAGAAGDGEGEYEDAWS
jgi:hypothetical protein